MLLFNHMAIYSSSPAFTTSKQKQNLKFSLITSPACHRVQLHLLSSLLLPRTNFHQAKLIPCWAQAPASCHKPMWEGPVGPDDALTVTRFYPLFSLVTRGLEGPVKIHSLN